MIAIHEHEAHDEQPGDDLEPRHQPAQPDRSAEVVPGGGHEHELHVVQRQRRQRLGAAAIGRLVDRDERVRGVVGHGIAGRGPQRHVLVGVVDVQLQDSFARRRQGRGGRRVDEAGDRDGHHQEALVGGGGARRGVQRSAATR